MPVHRPIASAAYVSSEQTVAIKTFQFLDDGDWAKVYLPLMNLHTISQDDLEPQFETDSMRLLVRGLQKSPLEFKVPKLHKAIVPEECSVKILRLKLLIKLKKAKETRTKRTPKPKVEPADADAAAGVAPAAKTGPSDPDQDAALPATEHVDNAPEPSGAADDASNVAKKAGSSATSDAAPNESPDESKVSDLDDIDSGSDGANPDDSDMIEEEVQEVPHWYKLRAD